MFASYSTLATSVLVLLACASAQSSCTDNPPDQSYTCAQQKGFGKCGKPYITSGSYCQITCGTCPKESPAATAPSSIIPAVPVTPPPTTTPLPAVAASPVVAAPMVTPPAVAAAPAEIPTDLVIGCGGMGSDILTFLQAQPQLSTISAALVGAQLSARLADRMHPVTLFAPTNKAFAQWEADSMVNVTSVPSLSLRPLLLYHVVAGGISPSRLLTTPFLATGCTGQQLFGLEKAKISGEKSHANILRSARLCQSYVYLIDYVLLSDSASGPLGLPSTCEESSVLGPSAANMTSPVPTQNPCTENATAWEALQNNTLLATTKQVLQATGYEGLMENGTARFTLFAPTNDAWVAAAARLNTTIAAIMSNQTELLTIVNAHLMPWHAPVRKLTNRMYNTLQPDSPIAVKATAGDIRIQSPTTDADVLMADIDLSCYSSVHVITAVLLPPSVLTSVGPKVTASSRG